MPLSIPQICRQTRGSYLALRIAFIHHLSPPYLDLTPYTLDLIPETWYLIPYTLLLFLIPSTLYLVPDTLYLVPCYFSYGFFKVSSLPGGHMPFVAGHRPAVLDCVFTVLGEGRARLVHAKWSVAALSTVKQNAFVNFLLPRPPGASWVPWVPLGASCTSAV